MVLTGPVNCSASTEALSGHGKTESETISGVISEWGDVSFLIWCEGLSIKHTGSHGPVVLYYLMGAIWQGSESEKTAHGLRKEEWRWFKEHESLSFCLPMGSGCSIHLLALKMPYK